MLQRGRLAGFVSLACLFCLSCNSGGRSGGPVEPEDPTPPARQTGSVEVVTSTTGDATSLDANGFVISIDGQGGRSIGINATVVIPAIPAGARSLLLGGAAVNCSITEENPRNVMIVAADTVHVAFTITCAPVRATLV